MDTRFIREIGVNSCQKFYMFCLFFVEKPVDFIICCEFYGTIYEISSIDFMKRGESPNERRPHINT